MLRQMTDIKGNNNLKHQIEIYIILHLIKKKL